MTIKDYIPETLIIKSGNPLKLELTVIFKSQKEAKDFYYKYLINSNLKMNINPIKNKGVMIYFSFPKYNGYTFSIETPETDRPAFENIENKTLDITTGFIAPNGTIGRFSPCHKLRNAVTFN